MKNSNKKIYYTSALTALVILLLFFLAILPLIHKIKIASNNLIKSRTTVENIYADWFSLRTSEKELSQIDREKLEKNFLDPERPLDFILILENNIRKTNLRHEIKIFTLSVSPAEKQETTPFQITLWGAFPNFMHFLNELENMPYYAEIDSFQIRRLDEQSIATEKIPNLIVGDIKAILNIKVYARQ